MTNIRDIARAARVSVATVSRFLDPQKKSLVQTKTREKIEKVIQRYRYIPNRAAQTLSRQLSNTIGMVTPFSSDVVKSPYFEGLIAGIIEGIEPLSYDLKWIMIREQEFRTCDLNSLIQKYSVDGLIFLSWRLMPNLVNEVERHSKIPAVLINDFDAKVKCNAVYCENQSGVFQVCSYLKSKGYKKIGMLRGPEYISLDAKKRFLAFKISAKKLGFRLKDDYLQECPRFEEDSAYEAMLTWIRKGEFPDAIFCAGDAIARGAIRALKQEKIKVPEHVGIVGYDDSNMNDSMIPALTSVRQPLEAMGKASIEILSKLLAKKAKTPIQLKFEPELIVRDSA